MAKKIIAFILLAIVLAVPVFIALWFAFPLVIGVLTVGVIFLHRLPAKYRGRLSKGAFVSAIVIILFAGVWMAFWPRTHPPIIPYEASVLNQTIAELLPRSAGARESSVDALEAARRSFQETIDLHRRKVDLIQRARELYRVADLVYGRAANRGIGDIKDFGAAKEQLRKALEGEASSSNLFMSDMLQSYLKAVRSAIDSIEAEGLKEGLSIDALNDLSFQVPTRLGKFAVDPKFDAAAAVQSALTRLLAAGISARTSYDSYYVGDRNALVSRQSVFINLDKSTATDVDLSGFLALPSHPGGPLVETVKVKDGSGEFRAVDARRPSVTLTPGTRVITIESEVVRRDAARSLTLEVLPWGFTEVVVDWPLKLRQSLTLLLRSQDDQSVRWPFTVMLDGTQGASLQRIVMPRDSVYLTAPATKLDKSALGDQLEPTTNSGELNALANGTGIRVQLMPKMLRNEVAQAKKAYFATENLIAAAIIWIATTLAGLLLLPKPK